MWPHAPAWGPGRPRFTSSVGAKDGSEESFAPRGANLQLQRTPHAGAWGYILSPLRGYIYFWTDLVIDRRYSLRSPVSNHGFQVHVVRRSVNVFGTNQPSNN